MDRTTAACAGIAINSMFADSEGWDEMVVQIVRTGATWHVEVRRNGDVYANGRDENRIDASPSDAARDPAREWTLPPFHEVVTFTRGRWWEVMMALLDQHGEVTCGVRETIHDMHQLAGSHGAGYDDPMSLVFPAHTAEMIRWWERDRTDPSTPGQAGTESIAVCRACGNTGWADLDNAYCLCPYGQSRSLDDEKAQERRWRAE